MVISTSMTAAPATASVAIPGADPVRIYVLWHPDCPEGRTLAGAVFKWFRGDPADLTEAGYGIPVRYRFREGYRFEANPDWRPGEPRPLKMRDTGGADFTFVVALVDEHMVVDPHWRRYLTCIDDEGEQRVRDGKPRDRMLLPVALSSTAYQLPGSINRLNFLRLDRATDPSSWSWEERTRTRRERLLSLLTQVVARELSWWSGTEASSGASAPIKVFISHAKADGVQIAEALRQAIQGHGQLRAFFDESDLAIGYPFAETLEAGATSAAEDSGTQAMIAVYTDAYAGRPWCQRELRLARRPTPIKYQGQPTACWRVKPLLIVSALDEGNTRMLAEAGHAPVIAWREEQVCEIIDRLLREVVLFAYNERRALALQANSAGSQALNCTPDLYAAMEIARGSNWRLTCLIIPPPGLPTEDREVLQGLLRGGSRRPKVSIRTFDEL